MISVKHLTKCYGEFTAVDDLSFEIDEGHVYGFLGPNGAGKSTTMNIITGCLSATSGQVTIDGHDIFEEPKEAKRAIGYLPEIPPLYTNETPEEYLKFVAEAKGLKGKEMDRQIEGVISQTRIQNVRKRLISKLSKGYRQRVGIAQALLGNPKVIILDEPTVGLDPIQIIEIRDLIKQLGKNHTVILSSHILSEVQAICEKVLIISGGKLIAFDEPEHLEKSLAGSNEILFTTEATREEVEEVKSLLGEITEVSYRETQDGLLSVTMKTDSDDIRGISRKLSMEFAKREKALYELTSKKANLEDIFLELTEAADPADVPEKDSEQVKADLRDMEISGLEEIGGLEKDETDEEEYVTSENAYSGYSGTTSFDGEGAITSAIDYVVNSEQPKMYILNGHGEAELSTTFSNQLTKENIETEEFSLLTTNEVPDDVDFVLINAPSSDISEEEKNMLESYFDNGGKLLVMAGPVESGNLPNLYSLLSDYGVKSDNGVVVDTDHDHYAFQAPYILMPTIESSDITDPLLDESYYAIVPIARGLEVGNTDKDVNVTSLLTTSDEAYSKAAGYNLTTYDKEDGDTDGPFALGVDITQDENDGQMIWYASSYLVDDTYNSYSSGANLDLVMNSISSLVGQRDAVSIRSKSLQYNYLTISDSTSSILKLVMIGVFPIVYLAVGIAIVVKRRRANEAN